jgi:hypothetical protein
MRYRKGSADLYGSLWCWPFAGPCSCSAAKYPRPSMDIQDRRHPHAGPVREAAIMLRLSLELPSFVQNALIPFAGDPDALQK